MKIAGPLAALMRAPLLSQEREAALALAWQSRGDRRALDELITAHARLAIAHAAKVARYGHPLDDLTQEGLLAMTRAASLFDPSRGVRFSTFATYHIKAAVQMHVWRYGQIVALPTSLKKRSLCRRLRIDQAVPLTGERASALADEYGVDVTDVQTLKIHVDRRSSASLDKPFKPDSSFSFMDVLLDDTQNPEADAIALIDGGAHKARLEEALLQLRDRERLILRRRWLSDDPATLDDLRSVCGGITKERIRQIEVKALDKLKVLLGGTGDAPRMKRRRRSRAATQPAI